MPHSFAGESQEAGRVPSHFDIRCFFIVAEYQHPPSTEKIPLVRKKVCGWGMALASLQ